MKKTILSGFAAMGVAFGAATASATSNGQYPASDFQPKVIFADEEMVAKSAHQTQYDPKYPATSFEPKVVFADPDLIAQSKPAANRAAQTKFDPKYPAASFEPKVIFP